ncbi:MAG TPA: hypothetical protein PLS53_00255 [Thermoanaerobaculaceae bacterium]|nr:hypothetical protein [Thermoanaerobaculaceae bacterium]HPS76565.1 hypothetical protein [Thermoanaerobaculaceae bacterium]
MTTAILLLKTALERKSAFLLETVGGGGIGALVGASRPDSVKKKGHGAARAALTGAGTGLGAGIGGIAGGLAGGLLGAGAVGREAWNVNHGGQPSSLNAALALGLPLAGAGLGALTGGTVGYHVSKDDEVDELLEKEKNKDR